MKLLTRRGLILQSRASRGGGAGQPPPLDPVARWTFDSADVSGATASDIKGTAHGTLVGSPSLVTGIIGDQAISVNNAVNGTAATKYMVVPAASLPGRPTSFSFSFWTKNLVASTLQSTLVCVGKSTGGTAVNIRLWWSSFNKWQLIAGNTGAPAARYNVNPPNGSGTHFYAATYDENNALNWRFYIDGVEKTATATSNMGTGKPMDWGTDRDLYFLAGIDGVSAGIVAGSNCIADDLRFYNRVLTAQEISDRYDNPALH